MYIYMYFCIVKIYTGKQKGKKTIARFRERARIRHLCIRDERDPFDSKENPFLAVATFFYIAIYAPLLSPKHALYSLEMCRGDAESNLSGFLPCIFLLVFVSIDIRFFRTLVDMLRKSFQFFGSLFETKLFGDVIIQFRESWLSEWKFEYIELGI